MQRERHKCVTTFHCFESNIPRDPAPFLPSSQCVASLSIQWGEIRQSFHIDKSRHQQKQRVHKAAVASEGPGAAVAAAAASDGPPDGTTSVGSEGPNGGATAAVAVLQVPQPPDQRNLRVQPTSSDSYHSYNSLRPVSPPLDLHPRALPSIIWCIRLDSQHGQLQPRQPS